MVQTVTIPTTVDQLSDELDREFSWRRKELSTLKTVFQRANYSERDALGRAAIVALYAHWEGFVREAVQLYLHHVSCRNLTLDQLPIGMMFAWYPNALARAAVAGGNTARKVELVQEISALRSSRVKRQKPEIETRSNLRLEVLVEISCLAGGLGLAEGVDRVWLDEKLVKKRNTIAHGRSAAVDFEEFTTLLDLATGWMQGIINKLVIAAQRKSYLVTA